MIPRASIVSIIEEAIDLFKANYKLFLTISFLSAVCGLLFTLGNELINTEDTMNAVVFLLLLVISVYFSIRLQIALIIAINNRYQEFETDFQECFKTAGSYFWSYFFASIALAFIIGFSIAFVFFSISMQASSVIIAVTGLIFGGLALVLLYFFNFAPLLTILDPGAISYFRKSRELVKRQPNLVVSMLALGLIAQVLIYLTIDTMGSNSSFMAVNFTYILEFISDLILAPLFAIVYLLVYYKLVENSQKE